MVVAQNAAPKILRGSTPINVFEEYLKVEGQELIEFIQESNTQEENEELKDEAQKMIEEGNSCQGYGQSCRRDSDCCSQLCVVTYEQTIIICIN